MLPESCACVCVRESEGTSGSEETSDLTTAQQAISTKALLGVVPEKAQQYCWEDGTGNVIYGKSAVNVARGNACVSSFLHISSRRQ